LVANQFEILEHNCYSFLKAYFHHWCPMGTDGPV